MRRKIAKRKRRDILRKGATFTEEKWLYEEKERIGFSAHSLYFGWEIYGCGRDELEAYKSILDIMPWCEENPRTDDNGHISINGKEIPVTGVMSL